MCWLRKSAPDTALEHEGKLDRCTPFSQPQRRAIRRALYAILTVLAMFVFFGFWLWQGIWRALAAEALFLLSLLIFFSLLEVPQAIAVCIWGRPAPHFLWMEGGDYLLPRRAVVQTNRVGAPGAVKREGSVRRPSWD